MILTTFRSILFFSKKMTTTWIQISYNTLFSGSHRWINLFAFEDHANDGKFLEIWKIIVGALSPMNYSAKPIILLIGNNFLGQIRHIHFNVNTECTHENRLIFNIQWLWWTREPNANKRREPKNAAQNKTNANKTSK